MKVSLGINLQEGAFGGGNQFGRLLAQYLTEQGVEVSYDLNDPTLDIILLAEPDYQLKISAYDHYAILNYLRHVNPQAIVVHRLNNSSQARDDARLDFNRFRLAANRVADFTVFVSNWLYEAYAESGFSSPNYRIIYNGADQKLWQPEPQTHSTPPFRIVTHHWSTHANKGFDIYQRLDALLTQPPWRDQVAFTYIGRMPEGATLPNSHVLPPLAGQALADELKRHTVYLTASRFEAGPNHCLEGALCGLPLLYIESGAMPEYAQGFGVGFNSDNFETQLAALLENYDHWHAQMPAYPFTDAHMGAEYFALFQELLAQREKLYPQRRWVLPSKPLHSAQINQWLQDLRPHLLRFAESLQQKVGHYQITTQGLTPEGEAIQLPWSCLALKLMYTLGEWEKLPLTDQQAWTNFILDFQVEGNPQWLAWGKNAFRDPTLVTAVMSQTRRLDRWKNRFFPPTPPSPLSLALSAESKQAIATLHEIGVKTRFPYQGFPTTLPALQGYLHGLDWSKPWMSGAHLATLAVFYHTEAPRFLATEKIQILKNYCGEFVKTLHQPENGAYYHGEKPAYGELVNGVMKILTALDWLEIPIHSPEQLIDTVLSQLPEAEGCHLVDAVYVLYRCQQQTAHRQAEVQAYCLRVMEQIMAHFNPLDGGFSYYLGRSQSHFHRVRVTRQRPVSDLHGTLLLTWAVAMIAHLLGMGTGWRVLRP